MRCAMLMVSALVMVGCASAPDTENDPPAAMPASVIIEPPAPIEIVEVPRILPLAGQYNPKPRTLTANDRMTPAERIAKANAEARIEPAPEGFINAMQVWPYSDNALYQLHTRPDRVTDIALEAGERLISASGADPVRWIIGDTTSGEGAAQRVHIIVKPTRVDLNTNLIIHTDRRSYHLELNSTASAWMASVAWSYPHAQLQTLRRQNAEVVAATPVADGLALEQLNFRYRVSGDTPSWRPLRAFDDGSKVYIQFPPSITRDEMPPLFVVGTDGDTQLVNYRVRTPYFIVDRLFSVAELRLGKPNTIVRIEREDFRAASRRTTHSRGPRP